MNTQTSHHVETTVDDHHYRIDIKPLEPPGGLLLGPSERVRISATVVDGDGRAVANGAFEAKWTVLDPLIRVIGAALGSATTIRSGRYRSSPPANSGVAWSDSDDLELERRWLAGHSVAELATLFDRSPGSIRARLPRVGCDPQRPGEHLPVPPSQRRPPDLEMTG